MGARTDLPGWEPYGREPLPPGEDAANGAGPAGRSGGVLPADIAGDESESVGGVCVQELEEVLSSLAPPWAAVAAVPIAAAEPLLPEETSFVARAVASRRAEFGAGRTAARKAMARLGVGPFSIPVGRHRAPVWPVGIIGSITHAEGWAAAIVGPAAPGRALGLDIERNGRVTEEIAETIRAAGEGMRPEEAASLVPTGLEPDTLRFAAKEAAFKAYWPVNRHFVGFSDARVTFAPPRIMLSLGAMPLHGARALPFAHARVGTLAVALVGIG
ncbi:4'-phosphopantetheinyl transferase family protein [Pseudoroseicyclus tamaricis]|nr:4'-phosphopantetheinyl transferase superfamily protein [Pseudoroseicyclus tamaricis]